MRWTHITLQMNSFAFEASVQLYVDLLCFTADCHSMIVCVDVKESWLYHLSVAAGTTLGKVGTEFEQLVGKLYQQDGDPSESLDRFCSSLVRFLSFFIWPLEPFRSNGFHRQKLLAPSVANLDRNTNQ